MSDRSVTSVARKPGDHADQQPAQTAGQETKAVIAIGLDGARINVTWKPHEIKTLRLEKRATAPGAMAPAEVNMLEESKE